MTGQLVSRRGRVHSGTATPGFFVYCGDSSTFCDPDVPVHRLEAWERMHAGSRPDSCSNTARRVG